MNNSIFFFLCYFATLPTFAQAPIVADREISYLQFAAPESVQDGEQGDYFGAHLEENHLTYADADRLMLRHAEGAAFAFHYSAQKISKTNQRVKAYDMNPFVGGQLSTETPADEDVDRTIMDHVLEKAVAVSLSMNTNSKSRFGITQAQIPEHFAKWEKSDTILTQSAGNDGSYCSGRDMTLVGQQEFTFPQLADTYLRVGSAVKFKSSDRVMIANHSSCSGADVVALNPFMSGVRFKFRPTPEEYAELFEMYEPQMVQQSSLNTALSTLKERISKDVDSEGFVTEVPGTSFVAPSVAGYFVGMKQLCPALSSHDLLAGAFAAATPVMSYDGFPNVYANNGVLPYDDIRGGFGYLSMENYRDLMMKACDELAKDPTLKTQSSAVKATFENLVAETTEENQKVVSFTINEDKIIFKMNLVLETMSSGVPFSMTIVSPHGVRVRVRPANANWRSPAWGLATTNGFFGNSSKGTWKIIMNQYKSVEKVQVHMSAVEKNGLVDRIIDLSKKTYSN